MSVAAVSWKLGAAASRRVGAHAVGRVWLWLRAPVPLLALSSAVGAFRFAGGVVVAELTASREFGAATSRKCGAVVVGCVWRWVCAIVIVLAWS